MKSELRRCANVVAAIATSVLVLGIVGGGAGPVPALSRVLDPAGGVWNWGRDANVNGAQTLQIAGLRNPATVAFDGAGVPTIHARSDWDLFVTEGYLHASFRITQLDIYRRVAEGRLAELTGPAAVASDKFELQLGLLRAARQTWIATPPGSRQAQALLAYSAGINDRLRELRRNGNWPSIFMLADVFPRRWTPVDSLAVQELLTQQLTYTNAPLAYAVLAHSLGRARTMKWFPVLPANQQHPYDRGPYRDLGISPLTAQSNANAVVPHRSMGSCSAQRADVETTGDLSTSTAHRLLSQVQRLPATRTHAFSASNSWVANGPAVVGHRSMLAGDPHLQLSLPSYWYELALSAPRTTVSGASLVGLPGVVIGRNSSIAWSMTDVKNQSTMFYKEQTRPDHPGEYCWRGAWRPFTKVHYTIPVRAGSDIPLTVALTVHGPVLTQLGQTVSVSWMGDYPAQLLQAMLAIDKAHNYGQFRHALRGWHAPTLNFTYADDQGHIAIMAAGYFPVVRDGKPWMPLPGTGRSDIAGTIPYAAAPQVYDPPDHVAATANQRPVGHDYPYYIGTSLDAFDNGYRAERIYSYLHDHQSMSAADFRTLQMDVTDQLATEIVPRLQNALQHTGLNRIQQQTLNQLTAWDDRMSDKSAGPTIWWTFWSQYLSVVFEPWWDIGKVPVGLDPRTLAISNGVPSLVEDLEAWTVHDGTNAAFRPPGRPDGTAASAMRTAFLRTVSYLHMKLGGDAAAWTWSRLHAREIPALSGTPALGYAPRPSGGDRWTVNAAEGGLDSSYGPSWRMVVAWIGTRTATATAIYPGGQSDNPASPWYQNLISDWWSGRQRAMPSMAGPPHPAARWTFLPSS